MLQGLQEEQQGCKQKNGINFCLFNGSCRFFKKFNVDTLGGLLEI